MPNAKRCPAHNGRAAFRRNCGANIRARLRWKRLTIAKRMTAPTNAMISPVSENCWALPRMPSSGPDRALPMTEPKQPTHFDMQVLRNQGRGCAHAVPGKRNVTGDSRSAGKKRECCGFMALQRRDHRKCLAKAAMENIHTGEPLQPHPAKLRRDTIGGFHKSRHPLTLSQIAITRIKCQRRSHFLGKRGRVKAFQ